MTPSTCSPTARRSRPTRCSSGEARSSRWSTNEGFADVIEIARQDRPSLYDPFVDRPAPLVRPCAAVRGAGPARRPTARSSSRSTSRPAPVRPRRSRGGGGVLPRTAILGLTTSTRRCRRARAARHRRDCVARGVARVPRVRAHRDHRRQRVPAAGRAAPTWAGSRELAPDGAGDDVGRRARAASPRRPSCPASLLLSGPAGGRARRGGRRARPTASPDAVTFDMGGTSTDVCLVARRRARRRRRAPRGRRASRCGCRRSTSTRSAPAAVRSPARRRGRAAWSGRRSAGADAGPGVLRARRDRADRDRRRPRARAHPAGAAFPGIGASTSTPRTPRSTRAGVERRGRRRGRRRGDGAGGAHRHCRAGRRPAGAARWSRSAAPARCTPARSPTRSGSRR